MNQPSLSRRRAGRRGPAVSVTWPSPAWPAARDAPATVAQKYRACVRRISNRRPNGSSSYSCRAASATSIRSTTSRRLEGRRQDDELRGCPRTGQYRYTHSSHRIMKPLWKFAQHGQCGRWASDLFPEINRHVDDLCFIHSLHTEGVASTDPPPSSCTAARQPSSGRRWGRGCSMAWGRRTTGFPGFVSIGPVLRQRRAAPTTATPSCRHVLGHGHR